MINRQILPQTMEGITEGTIREFKLRGEGVKGETWVVRGDIDI